jgi:hypothetical protein
MKDLDGEEKKDGEGYRRKSFNNLIVPSFPMIQTLLMLP